MLTGKDSPQAPVRLRFDSSHLLVLWPSIQRVDPGVQTVDGAANATGAGDPDFLWARVDVVD